MDVLKDEYEKCRGGLDVESVLLNPFYENSKYSELYKNILDKFIELITPCSHRWPPDDADEAQTLYMAACALSPDLIIKEFRIWITEVERDYKNSLNNSIAHYCEWINVYGRLPLDPVKPQKFMLKDEPWIAGRVASELQDFYTALCEYKTALCECCEWWNSRSAAGYFKKAVLKVVKNPITGVIDAVGNGIAEAFGEDEYSQAQRKFIAKGSAAQELCLSYEEKLCEAVCNAQDNRICSAEYWNKILNKIDDEFNRLNNLIDSDTKPLQIAGVPNASAPAASSTSPVIALPERPATTNNDSGVAAAQDTAGNAVQATPVTQPVAAAVTSVSVPITSSDEEEIDYVEIARDITEAMTIGEIRALLEEHGLDSSGLKKNLIGRLARALEDGKIKIN